MTNQILISKGSSNHLTSFICTSLSQLTGPDTRDGSKAKSATKSPKHKHTASKTQATEGAASENSETSQQKITKPTEQSAIPDAHKKKLMKSIENSFENGIRDFTNAAWAYLDIPEDEYIGYERMYFFNLLFGPENRKRKLFNRLRTRQTSVGSRSKTSKSASPSEQSTPNSANTSSKSSKQFNINMNYYKKTETIRDDIAYHLENKLTTTCASFFARHGLVVKVRRLPIDAEGAASPASRRTPRYYGSTSYPSYHFISRQRRHIVEQILRSRSFFETEYNSCTELRNFRSPFLLFEPHTNFLKYLQDIKKDLNDEDFTGLFISLNTLPHTAKTELGSVKRSKLVAWCLIEILSNNERCLNCLWVNPSLSATGTTDLLRSFIPFIMVTSFSVRPPNIDTSFKKIFYIWLADFDHFPRQALILMTSPYRFALEKHYDYSDEYQHHTYVSLSSLYSKYLYENNVDEYFSFGNMSMGKETSPDGDKFTENTSTNTAEGAMINSYITTEMISNSDSEEDDSETDEYMDLVYKKYLKEYAIYRKSEVKTCQCHRHADWSDVDKVVLSCSEDMMVDSIPRWLQLIRKYSSYLEEDIENIVNEKQNEIESSYEIKAAEFAKLGNNEIQVLCKSSLTEAEVHKNFKRRGTETEAQHVTVRKRAQKK
ncbi:conserved hypothetical protein [Theileria orientalis strain Shintoku]|uniref:Uncharacterized protein n=1 Tax=Theileria orientalis strain Shintoku TaxID=869250 RepID=J4C2L0_THEOR|nr:conserved hypothetical protein [Theileria orientalis strain Shintoku]BAM38876.1 conserved hypothetical protein [Theileria orientalis strain Shintoku]|eukprot:XP_009689177.1 conserved hypothetical protein [Theileria orientalis strain Shintoku]